MENFIDLCLKRQSCRSFADKPVEREKLLKCIEAARLAPSACNSQPWSFFVVEKPETVSAVAKATQQLGINEYFNSAKAFIVVMEEHAVLMPKIRPLVDSQYFAKNDIGAAAVNICLAAADLGLGTCIIGIYDREKIAELLNIPKESRFGSLIAVGYPSDGSIRPKARKPLEELVKFI